MIEWYKKVVLENYANFSGRARRSEYWYFVLANLIVQISLLILFAVFASMDLAGVGMIFYGILILYALGMFIPSLAVAVRRLHDVGKSGTFYFIGFIPFIGPIWLLVLFGTEGDNGTNKYGPDPKNPIEINEIGTE
ncbi:DUF805 domain-containing protein [Flavobacterium sp. HNIBRBA15423]|uniref:DUF805 domain-containing protein n=1 Tax=Flavobacterium sp. HNIBRBA15423 TaxID=3458683 RepID=UPI0040443B17